MLSASQQHVTDANRAIVKTKDVFDIVAHNINPLTKEDMKKILLGTTTKPQLCSHPILVL